MNPDDPFALFKEWYKQEQELTTLRIPGACCLSTNGTDGFPNARFVSLKGFVNNGFVITGTLSSRKGKEISISENVALTFWWTATERQVRIQGKALQLSAQLADQYFSERNKDSQIVSIISAQGEELNNVEELVKAYEQIELLAENKSLPRPENWGGYSIEPVRIEFMTFQETRFHSRVLFENLNGNWVSKLLKP